MNMPLDKFKQSPRQTIEVCSVNQSQDVIPDSYDHLHRSEHPYRSTIANRGRNFTTMKPMLATLGSIQSRPTYTGGKLMGTIWYYENRTVHYLLC